MEFITANWWAWILTLLVGIAGLLEIDFKPIFRTRKVTEDAIFPFVTFLCILLISVGLLVTASLHGLKLV